MMEILMFSPHSLNSPCTRRIFCFAKELFKRKHEPYIVLPNYDRHSGYVVETISEKSGVKFIRPFHFKSRILELAMLPYPLSSLIRGIGNDSDLIYTLKPSPFSIAGVFSKSIKDIPMILDFDDLDHMIMADENHPNYRIKIVELFEKVVPRFADHVITSSSFLYRYCTNNFGILPEKVTWIPNGVDVSEFEVAENYSYLKHQLSLREHVIVYMGSLNDMYKPLAAVKLMEKVSKVDRSVSCLIVGDGRFRNALQDFVHKKGLRDVVTLAGSVPHEQLPKYLSIADIGLAYFPDRTALKAQSNVKVFEYMAAGVVPVVSAIGDLPFYVENGKAGMIVNPHDMDALSEAVLDIIEDDGRRKEMECYARNHVKKNYDWSVLAQKMEKVMLNMVN